MILPSLRMIPLSSTWLKGFDAVSEKNLEISLLLVQ